MKFLAATTIKSIRTVASDLKMGCVVVEWVWLWMCCGCDVVVDVSVDVGVVVDVV